MQKFYKDRKIEENSQNDYYTTLCDALKTTTSVCFASSSALVVNDLSAKILPVRMVQYEQNSIIAIKGVGEIRSYLLKISKHLEDKKINFLDAITPIKQIMQKNNVGNCEHQSFYLAALLKQKNVPALIYNIEDINHTVVITDKFLLDPWIGVVFPLDTAKLSEFYNSSLNMKASWLNQLLSNKPFDYPKELSPTTLTQCFEQEEKEDQASEKHPLLTIPALLANHIK